MVGSPGSPGGVVEQVFLDALTRELDEGLVLVDGADRIQFLNAAAARLLDARPGDALATAAGDYRLIRLIEQARGATVRVERELTDVRGDTTLLARASGVDGTGTVALVLHDLTALRRLERVRRDFIANVSHELRTPVAAIQLLVETLQAGALGDPDAATEFVGRIGLEVTHMAQMVEELLDLSTIESGRLELRRERVAVAELLRAVERLRPLAAERGIGFGLPAPDHDLAVAGDATRLGHVLRNLVHNAIKFTPSGGSVEVAVGADTSTVSLTVADTGMGIAPQDQERIFERFWKADRSRQRDGEGSGLGLAIARHVVDAHGGGIAVTSRPGGGSSFVVTLPREH